MDYLYKLLQSINLIKKPEVEFKKPSGYKNVNTSSFKK